MNTAPRLRIRKESWETLRAITSGQRAPRSELRELWDLSVLDGTALTDPATELLQGILHASGVVRILGSDAGSARSASIWVDGRGVGLFDQTDGDHVILQRLERGMVPPAAIELLGLGPRPVPETTEPRELPSALVSAVLEPKDSDRPWEDLAEAIGGFWPKISDAVGAGGWRCWLLQAHVVDGGSAHVRDTVCFFDTPDGLLGIHIDAEVATLTPIAALELWKRLSHLVTLEA